MDENVEIESEFYGSLYERVMKDPKKAKAASRPKPEDYNLPRSQAELDILLQKMRDCGIDSTQAFEIIKEKKQQLERDCAEFDTIN